MSLAGGDHLTDRVSLRADRRAERRVLEVASGENLPALRRDRGAHEVLRVRRVRTTTNLARNLDELRHRDGLRVCLHDALRDRLHDAAFAAATTHPPSSVRSASRRARAVSSTSA